ncbi:MAG: GNAT family N-acetyltransferase [Chloroflexia bacterium]|nr:GNAT family N-acetyltransferase [Chloroflexia bacterium]
MPSSISTLPEMPRRPRELPASVPVCYCPAMPDPVTLPVLETPRLRLEPLVPAHATETFGPLGDERLYRFIPGNPPANLAALEARYGLLSGRRSPDDTQGWLNWVMRRRDSGEPVGTLEATVYPDRSSSIAYVVFVRHQRRGLATEGVARMVEHLVVDHGITLLVAEVDTRNAASVGLLDRLRFSRVATVRDADHFKGTPSDEFRYELRPVFPAE